MQGKERKGERQEIKCSGERRECMFRDKRTYVLPHQTTSFTWQKSESKTCQEILLQSKGCLVVELYCRNASVSLSYVLRIRAQSHAISSHPYRL
jgi:hypothetical protein